MSWMPFFRKLHHRVYEYEGFNGDYVCEDLIWELSDGAWFHLFQFLVLYGMTCCSDYPEDAMLESGIQLDYLGGSDRRQAFFDEMKNWRMSRRLIELLDDSTSP